MGFFLSPLWLLLFIAVAALIVVYVVLQLRRTRYVARFSNTELLGSIAPRRPGWRRHLTFAILLLALTVLTLGMARPSLAVQVPRERATVMLDIDVSLSMKATDVLPSRISAAKSAGKQFVDLLPSRINLGLVAFGGQANLLEPPTLDRDSVKQSIGGLELQESTAIGEAIFTSLQAIQTFEKSTSARGDSTPPARIVLLSDGSNTVGRSITAAIAAARQAHVEVSTIAFGTADGTVTYKGETLPVPADDTALQSIAQGTGGSFHTAASEAQLRTVYKDIGSQIGYKTEQKDISYRFLLAGLICAFVAGAASLLWSGRIA